MIENTLSICMIAKNEEIHIERCLKSIVDIADEIIVVDTGSTDKTIEICKKYDVKVYEYEWINDFSASRNQSLDYATKNWILFLDADEELPPEECEKLRQTLKQHNDYEGFFLRLTNIIAGSDVGDAVVFRLFRNRPEYRFVGKMHEQIIKSIQDRSGINSVASTQIKIVHYGYDPSLVDISKKTERNINLLLSYDEKDKDGYYYYALGNEYLRLNNSEKALECFNISHHEAIKTPGDRPIYHPYLLTSIIKMYSTNKKHNTVIKSIKEFKKECPNFRDLYFYECLSYMECAKSTRAKKSLSSYLACNQTDYSYPTSNFENNYDLSTFMSNLKQGSIVKDEKLLSGLIIAKSLTLSSTIIDSIKSLNEITCEVIVVVGEASDAQVEAIENLGARVLKIDFESNEKAYKYGFGKCRGKYILILEPHEVCSVESQRIIVDLLDSSPKDYYYVSLADKQYSNNIGKSLRLVKNNKKLNTFESFPRFVIDNKIKDSNIHLYR